MWCHISVPQSDRSPVEIQHQVCVVLPKSRDESRCQRSGELQVLVCKQEWCYSSVQSNVHISHNKPWTLYTWNLMLESVLFISVHEVVLLFIHLSWMKQWNLYKEYIENSQNSTIGPATNHKAEWVRIKFHIIEEVLWGCMSTRWHCNKGNFISSWWGILQLLFEK